MDKTREEKQSYRQGIWSDCMKKKIEPVITKTAKVSMLGGFSITVDGVTLSDDMMRTRKLWNILSYLIIHRHRSVPQTEFIEQVWSDETSASPANALKTLLYRTRTILEPMFDPELQPIVSQRGGYQWNSLIATEVDVDEFESLCTQAKQSGLTDAQRSNYLQKAVKLYSGDFLPKLSYSLWVAPLFVRYRTLYLDAVKQYARLCEADGRYEEAAAIAREATKIDPLDEEIHTIIVRSLLNQGQNSAALAHYGHATELLFSNLGMRPCAELSDLYGKIMSAERTIEVSLSTIQSDLRERDREPGAFLCEYGFFRKIYQLEARRCARSGLCIHIVLLTITKQDGGLPALKALNTAMQQLLPILASSLRNGDVFAKYSGAQYVIMLPGANYEDSAMVMERIIATFYQTHRNVRLKISTRIGQVELTD